MKKGIFIVLEGLDYSGKTTLATKLSTYLNEINISTVHTSCSSSSNPLSQVIKTYVLDSEDVPSADTQAMLYGACINDLVERVLLPNVTAGNWVVCERYTLSTKVYQTHSLITSAIANSIDRRLQPDITFVLDITPQVYVSRAETRNGCPDALERVSECVLSHRRKQYRLRVRSDPKTISLDATMSPDELLAETIKYLQPFLN